MNILHEDETVSPLSIACAPNDNSQLEFHLFHPPQNLAAQDLMRIAREQKIWRMTGPYGNCMVSRLDTERPVIFVARGTGFASVKAMIEGIIRLPLYPAISFYWSVPQQAYFYMNGLLEEWLALIPDFSYTPIALDKEAAMPRVLLQTILRDHKDLSALQVYASGSPSFVFSVFSELHFHGLERKDFYSDVL